MKRILKHWKTIVTALILLLGGGKVTWDYMAVEKIEVPEVVPFSINQPIKVVPTPMDSLNPSAPIKVYRVHFLTYRDIEISGPGLPSYQMRDYYSKVDLVGARGRLNFENLNAADSTVLQLFDPVVFIGEQ